MLRKCLICGSEFESTRKKYCNNIHKKKCIICGEEFSVKYDRLFEFDKINTCGKKECASLLRSRSMKNTAAFMPPGWNIAKTIFRKTCAICGKEFETHNYKQVYCENKHYKTCTVCGSKFYIPIDQWNNPTQTCSEKCSRILCKKTSLERYGSEYYSSTEGWKNSVQSNKDKQDAKRRKTSLERYGVENYCQTVEWKSKRMRDPSKLDNLKLFEEDPENFIFSRFKTELPTMEEMMSLTGVNDGSIRQTLLSHGCRDLVTCKISNAEKQIHAILDAWDVTYLSEDRQEIRPKELDIYIPELSIGIECNPTATHNSSHHFMDEKSPGLPAGYHKMKTDMCEEKGIFLFHIFGYEWTHKQPIIESMIKNLLGKNDCKIYARKCVIKEVTSGEAFRFLEDNHRQGGVNSKIRLGLYYEDELVSLMTFGKMRSTIGTGNEDLSDCFELVRFCNKLNTTVIGGASKLFKHFVRMYNPVRIRSFSDRAHTRGTLYSNLGFKEIRRSDAGYVWVDLATDIAYNRVNTQKRNLTKFLNDENIDLSESEKCIMEEHGFVQVFDSGTITWEWKSL